jgi:hypothetical protein
MRRTAASARAARRSTSTRRRRTATASRRGRTSGNLPNAPVNFLAYDRSADVLYAATDLGVFFDKNGKRNWKRVGRDLPDTPVLDIKITTDGRTLYAATFGRSVWSIPLTG